MNWTKKGLIYTAPNDGSWRDNSALTPTPFQLTDDVIRVFCGFRDPSGVSRIGYVDVDAHSPENIVKISESPVLDIGSPGMFDDNGVILGDVIRVGQDVYMFYVGFQLVERAKFLAYSGLAISKDNGNTFHRYQQTPILDRSDEALHIRAIHTVIYENDSFHIWYATGSGWEEINGKKFPKYDINYLQSDNLNFPKVGVKCIENDRSNLEYRIGRPRVYKNNDGTYLMNYTFGTIDGRYQAGQATSNDGIHWDRQDDLFPLRPSDSGWDSIHLCYPVKIHTSNSHYMFYNGNNMGIDGFGFAVHEDS